MNQNIKFVILIVFIVLMKNSSFAVGPVNPFHKDLKWKAPVTSTHITTTPTKILAFEGANYLAKDKGLPSYSQNYYFNKKGEEPVVELINQKFETLTEANLITNKTSITSQVNVVSKLVWYKKSSYVNITFIPIRKNPTTGAFEKLVSYDVSISSKPSTEKALKSNAQTFVASSVLGSGNWYKIAVTSDGIYMLNYSFLKSLGIDVTKTSPQYIKVYGNGGAMLPYLNSTFRHDDLVENPVKFIGNNTESAMQPTDYFLFFGQGPNRWVMNENSDSSCHPFSHVVNVYSDTTYYFITVDNSSPGKRISTNPSLASTPNSTVNTFNDYAYHEADLVSLLKSGRQWYGESFNILSSYNFTYNFPNDIANTASINARVASNFQSANTTFTFGINSASNALQVTVSDQGIGGLDGPVANENSGCANFPNDNSGTMNVTVSYANPGNADAWLTWFELNVRRQLSLNGVSPSMLFRDRTTIGAGHITEFDIANASSNIEIWDVTDPTNEFIQGLSTNSTNTTLKFVIHTDTLHEFIAYDKSLFYPLPVADGKIHNQNLHANGQKDMIIVAYPDFVEAAVSLGNFHQSHDNLSYVVVTPQQIYNEYSSGKQDVTAIRSFVKMFYDRAGVDTTKLPQYLLLFGDGSFDPKNRIANNTDFIIAFENADSVDPTGSYTSDDFFGLLDDDEGLYDDGSDAGVIDIAIGRIEADNINDAAAVVNKIIHYETPPGTLAGVSTCSITSNSVFGDWRNDICFVAGDKEEDAFVSDAEGMFNFVNSHNPVYNINKIYFDAYTEYSTPGGQRYPDVETAIDNQIERGCFIMNYTGHGGQSGWGFERCLGTGDVQAWTNINSLTCFFTATCQFSEWDDPTIQSAGEIALINPNGAAICLFSTVRLVYESANQSLNTYFYQYIFTPINGKMPSTGLVMELIKFWSGSTNTNSRNFSLLGDPAVTLDYPHYNVVTTAVNGVTTSMTAVPDTLKALEKVTIAGYVTDNNGNKLTSFNGYMQPTVFDKFATIYTLGNDATSPIVPFQLQQNIIYNGKASITNGNFSYTFIVPKDISFQYGFGKLSYYGYTPTTDANGYFNNIIVGGYNVNAAKDTVGPTIKLYINDANFVNGGTTDANPIVYAILNDSSGINTVGNGIGHDITVQVDNNNQEIYVVNSYYQAALNNYQSGTVFYPLTNLAPGPHTILFKAWDVYNNSSSATLDFIVEASTTFSLAHVLNYPNPFTTHTSFFFEHNCPCQDLSVLVQIYTVTGKLIKTINTEMHTEGYRSSGIEWDGKDDYNDRIGKGVYIYRLKVRNPEGEIASHIDKLVILH